MKKAYPYLKDYSFLNRIYQLHHKTIYSKITVLDWQERRLKEIQGKTISGSVSVNGDSSVRRTANLSIKIKDNDDLYKNADSLFTINKKVFLEIGIKNNIAHLGYYPEYDTIWFPFGVYVIQNHSISRSTTDITLSLSLGDKMCLLNGEAGGTIPASTNFESYDTLGPDGNLHSELLEINRIIPELVNHFGNEDLNNIIVNDIDDRIKQVLKWRGENALFLWLSKVDPRQAFYTTIDKQLTSEEKQEWEVRKITYNYDAGYTYIPFVYPGELAAGAGDTVCTVLDKIKNTLGNYEYYYDIFGTFIFQEIKNYVNVSEWRTLFQEYKEGNEEAFLPYAYNTRLNTAVYSFENTSLITGYNNNPQFNMVKNDFVVWGARKGENGITYPCRYHLAIDTKPIIENMVIDNICFDTSVDDGIRRAFICNNKYVSLKDLKDQMPQGIVGTYYAIPNDNYSCDIYTWVTDINNYNNLLNNYLTSAGLNTSTETTSTENTDQIISGYIKLPLATYYDHFKIFGNKNTTNWRNVLYFQGLLDSKSAQHTNYYWAEMRNEWPKIYDIENNAWRQEALDFPASLDWWLDFIDNDASINQFSVEAIGRRSYAKVDNECNCVFEPDIPDIIMINTLDTEGTGEEIIDYRTGMKAEEIEELGLIPVQVSDSVYSALMEGGTFNSCYQHVRQLLTNYTNYNENISVTCIPIYHLEPNTRVFFNDPKSGIYGDYIVNTINFDLSGGSMSISAKKVIEKI